MVNGTLAQWRSKNQIPVIATMHRLVRFWYLFKQLNGFTDISQIREVAEGLCYLHSEGIVHGGLNGVSSSITYSPTISSHYL